MAEREEIIIITKEQGTKKTSKAQKDLQKDVKRTSKAVDEQGETFLDSAKDVRIFGISFNSLSSVWRSSIGTIRTSVTALKAFRVALIATGIGAVVVALGSFVTFLTRSQEGIDKVNRVLNVIKFTFDAVLDSASDFGQGLFQIFSGDVIGGFNTLKTTISGVGDAIERNIELAEEYSDLQIQIQNQEINSIVQVAAINNEIHKRREILGDLSKSEAERVKAGEEALFFADMLQTVQENLIKQRIREIDINLEASKTLREDLKERAELQAQLINAESQAARTRLRIIGQLNSARKQASSEEIEITERLAGAEISLEKQKANVITSLTGITKESINQSIEGTKASIETRQLELEQIEANTESTMKFGTIAQTIGSQLGVFGKAGAIAQAIINTAQGITKALAELGPAGPPVALALGAAGAAQIAKIKSTKIPGASGGDTGGSAPSFGGISFPGSRSIPQVRTDNSDIIEAIGRSQNVLVLDDLHQAQNNRNITVRNAGI